MNKKVLLLIAVLLCGIGSEAVAQEKSKTWTLQAGIGYGDTEYVGQSFASGFYVGKRFVDAIEVGFTVYNLLRQDREYGFSYAEATDLPYYYIHITQYEDATWKRLEAGSATSYMAVAGFSPIKLIWKNSRHDLVLSGQAGLSYKHANYLYRDEDKMHVLVRTYSHAKLSYGARLAYEYRISNTLGAGATATYDFEHEILAALATFNVHF